MRIREALVYPDGLKIKQYRQECGWTQQQLADKSGYHKRTIEYAEEGRRTQETTLREIQATLSKSLGTAVTLTRQLPSDDEYYQIALRIPKLACTPTIVKHLTALLRMACKLANLKKYFIVESIAPTTSVTITARISGSDLLRLLDATESVSFRFWLIRSTLGTGFALLTIALEGIRRMAAFMPALVCVYVGLFVVPVLFGLLLQFAPLDWFDAPAWLVTIPFSVALLISTLTGCFASERIYAWMIARLPRISITVPSSFDIPHPRLFNHVAFI